MAGLSRRGQGAQEQPISGLMERALGSPKLISLAAGFVDPQTLPIDAVRDAFAGLFADEQRARDALQYGTTAGSAALRDWIREQARLRDGGGAERLTREQVVVTAGSNQLLHLVVESLCDSGDIVLCAAPTYLVFLGTLAHVGAQAVGVSTDAEGMQPAALIEALEKLRANSELPRVKAIYLVTHFDNPCGITMPPARMAEIIEIAHRFSVHHRLVVIADEAYRELRYGVPDLPGALRVDPDGETVIVAGTFSKSFSPGLRIGWGILPRRLVDPICHQKGNIDFGSPHFSQSLMTQVVTQGQFASHLERLRAAYRVKRDAMLEAAETHFRALKGVTWNVPDGGLYIWVTLPTEIDAGPHGPLLDKAIDRGVLYVPGQYTYPRLGQPVANNTMRLSFGVQTPERIQQGIAALAEAIRAVQVVS